MKTAPLALLLTSSIACSTTNEVKRREIKLSAEPRDAWLWQESAGGRRTLGQGTASAEQIYEVESTEFSSWAWLSVLLAAPLIYIPVNKGSADGYDQAMGLFAIPIGVALVAGIPCLLGELGVFDSTRTTVKESRVGASLDGYGDESLALSDAAEDQVSFRLRRSTPETALARAIDAAPAKLETVVAVFDIQDSAAVGTENALSQLTDYLSIKLTEVAGYRVIPREQLRARLQERKAEGYQSCFDESCQVELGKAVAAQKTLATKILRVGGECAISTGLFDLRTETAEKAASVRTPCSDRGLIDGVDRLIQRLAKSGSE